MSSRWRERKGQYVSAGELQARRKALLTPVPKYRQAWVQVSPHSSYKVLKWIRRDHPTRPLTGRSTQSDQISAPCFINDPNTIDGSSDEENDLEDDDDGGGSERNGDPTVAGAGPSRSFKLGRKTSRAIAETEGAGGQLAGLETGHIAEQIEIDDDEEEDRSMSATQDQTLPLAPTPSDPQLASERSPLPQSQANEEVELKDIDMQEQSSNDPIDGQSDRNEAGDVTMRESDDVSGQARWTEKSAPTTGSDHPLRFEKPLDVSIMPSLSTAPPELASLPSIVADEQLFVEDSEHSKAPQSARSFEQSLPPKPLQPPEISASMEVDTPQTQEASPPELWQQSETTELPDSRTTVSSGLREAIDKNLASYPIPETAIPGLATVGHEGSSLRLGLQPMTAEAGNTTHHLALDHVTSTTTLHSQAPTMIPDERNFDACSVTEMNNDGRPVADHDGISVTDDDGVPMADNDGAPLNS
ncbi:hypothetical protein DFH28DRAFT_1134649 [Melampsora americana]|nr:hypothetical protein DFH28DRAFT_1134649 [Melampsora americana]